MLVAYHMMLICPEICIHLLGSAEIGKHSIINQILIDIHKFICVLSDIAGVVGYKQNSYTFLLIESFKHLEESFS